MSNYSYLLMTSNDYIFMQKGEIECKALSQ